MRMILGLDVPTSGTASVGAAARGARCAGYLDWVSARRRSGAPTRSAYDHLRALAVTNGIPKSRVSKVLDMVGLGEVGMRRSGGFSLGMGQRFRYSRCPAW